MKKVLSTCAPGPYLFGNGHDNPPTMQWCNAHIAPIGSETCGRAAVTLDTEHPWYGATATLYYPSDSYAYVVIGGSASGKTLYFARVRDDSKGSLSDGRTYTSAEALELFDPRSAMKLRKNSPYESYGPDRNMFIGPARTYLAREV